MVINSNYEFKSAIVVDENLLREIDRLIKEENKEPEYLAYLENKDEIQFESIDELVNYDNYENGRIKELQIRAGYELLIDISPSISPFIRYRSSVKVDFVSNNSEESELTKIKFKKLFKKHKQSKMHTIISKLSLPSMISIIIIFGFTYLISLYVYYSNNNIEHMPSKDMMMAGIIVLSVILFFVLGSYMQKKYFSPIDFSIGHRINELEKESKLKWNIIWAVIVPIVISLVSKYLL